MSLILDRGESAAAVADSVERYCASLSTEAEFPERWRGLAELGFFSIPRDFGKKTNACIVAAMETLGRNGFHGPLASTITFAACAPSSLVDRVLVGEVAISFGRPPLMPSPEIATVFVIEDNGEAKEFEVVSAEPVQMLSGDGWAKVDGRPKRVLGHFDSWQDRYDIALAGWLVGAGLELVEAAAEHASQRTQFGRTIREFQAVSAPLARAVLSLDAARVLADAAAITLDSGSGRLAAAARQSASRAAEKAALTAHQTYGAFGVLENGPVFGRSRRIRQFGAQFPRERSVDGVGVLGRGSSLGLVTQA